MTLTTQQTAWFQDFLGLTLTTADPADTHDPASASLFDTLQAGAQDLLASLGGGLRFDLGPKSVSPSDDAKKKLDDDSKKILAAMKDWQDRIAKVTITYEMNAQSEAYNKSVQTFMAALKAAIAKNDLTDAIKAIGSVEKNLKALEANAKDLPKKQKAATDAGDKIDKMSEADLGKMKPEDKAKIVKEMLGGGKPGGKVRDAQKKLYKNTPIDPGFQKDDQARQDKVAADLKGDKDLAEARGKWDKLDKDGLRKALNKIVAAQSKEYGIPPPSIVFFPDEEPGIAKSAGIVLGYFNAKDGRLHINLDPTAGIKDFTTTIDTVLHENMHHYQDQLVKLLAAGKLKPSDPRYKQALMFEVNSLEPGGYIDPDESADKTKGVADYENQPLERSAGETGAKTASKVSDAVKPPAKAP